MNHVTLRRLSEIETIIEHLNAFIVNPYQGYEFEYKYTHTYEADKKNSSPAFEDLPVHIEVMEPLRNVAIIESEQMDLFPYPHPEGFNLNDIQKEDLVNGQGAANSNNNEVIGKLNTELSIKIGYLNFHLDITLASKFNLYCIDFLNKFMDTIIHLSLLQPCDVVEVKINQTLESSKAIVALIDEQRQNYNTPSNFFQLD